MESRRNFMVKAALATLGGIISAPSIGKNTETIEAEIEKCRKIIENGQYEEILKNPCLVSALYYSEQALKKMAPPHQNSTEKIIWSLAPLITKDFRENYIADLKRIIVQRPEDAEKITSGVKSLPVHVFNFGKNLDRNHQDAIDLFVKESLPVCAMTGGLVVLAESGWTVDNELSTSSGRGGNTVIVFNLNDESFYRYAHMQEIKVSAGNIVGNGEEIGVVGHSGTNASKPGHGAHLHFEINRYDKDQGKMIPVNVFELKRELEALKND